ncbi:MAG: helix-turn-helix transcriptional regulator [Coriobacteriales bacterium]|jgi:DNA-binding CsgD family transcriptional regulator|nr:helix-turn-helix transcriptional regulator [Coriobacteriales bacterium]
MRRFVQRELWGCFITGVFILWGYVLLLNNSLFAQTTDVLIPIRFFAITATMVFLSSVLALLVLRHRRYLPQRRHILLALAYFFASCSCLFAVLCSRLQAPLVLAISLAAIFSAVALTLFSFAYFESLMHSEIAPRILRVLVSMIIALLLFLALLIIGGGGVFLLIITGILLVFASLIILHDNSTKNSHRIVTAKRRAFANKSESCIAQPPLSHLRQHIQANKHITAYALPFFLAALLFAYQFNCHPQTRYFPGEGYFAGIPSLSGSSLASLIFLLLLIAIILFFYIESVKPSLVLAGTVVFLLLASCFYFMSSISWGFPITYVFVNAVASGLLLGLLFLFLEALRVDGTKYSLHIFSGGLAVLSFGGTLGSLMAHFHIQSIDAPVLPVWGVLLIPAALFLLLIVSLLFSYKDIAAVFRRRSVNQDLDQSHLENRCLTLATHFRLTKREAEVLRLLAIGRNIPYIAESLHVSKSTAKTHSLQVYRKFAVSSHQELLDFIHSDSLSP